MFEFVRNNSGQNYPVIEQRPAKASTTYEPGMLLNLVGGVLTPATTGSYICAERRVTDASDAGEISVYPILPGMQWKTTFAVAASSVKVGDKVTVHTDFSQITATTTSGVFRILEMGDGAKDSTAVGEFVDKEAESA